MSHFLALLDKARIKSINPQFNSIVAISGILLSTFCAIITNEPAQNGAIGLAGITVGAIGLAISVVVPTIGALIALSTCLSIDMIPQTGFLFSFIAIMVCTLMIVGNIDSIYSYIVFILYLIAFNFNSYTQDTASFNIEIAMTSLLLCCLPWLAGRLSLSHSKTKQHIQAKFELQIAERRLNQSRRDNALARQIHDAVSNDLSRIIMLANTHVDDADYVTIAHQAQNALQHVHEVIDMLDSASSTNVQEKQEPDINNLVFLDELQQQCTNWDSYLQEKGIRGLFTITHDDECIDKHCKECAKSIIHEAYTNILRHCQKDDEYYFDIKIDKRGIYITQTNSCNHGQSGIPGAHSGKGLELHRRDVELLGGKFTTSFEDNTWVLNAFIPSLHNNPIHKKDTYMNKENNSELNSYQSLSPEDLRQYQGGGKVNEIYNYLHRVFGKRRH